MSSKTDEILKRIEKDRYLIPCKCLICNKSFPDVVLGTHHISKDHPKRKIKNVIDNLSWNIKDDLKKWEILLELKAERDRIINKLNDENAIKQAKIPDIVEIYRKKADISEIMKALIRDFETSEAKQEVEEEEEIEEIEEELDERDFESSDDSEDGNEEEISIKSEGEKDENEIEDSKPSTGKKAKKRNLCDLLERELEKYVDSIKRLSMASQVEQALKYKNKEKIRLYKLAQQLDYYLGISKAIKIIKASKQDLEIII